MPSQFATPLLLTEDATTQLERLPLSSQSGGNGYDEEWLQETLFRNPASLPITEIDRGFLEPVPVARELETPAGPVDLLYATPQGKLVLVETKLWRNPEARRKVVGQILDYAKELSRWGYEDLQREVSKETGEKGNTLYRAVASHPEAVAEAEFVDEVSRSLRTGHFLLLIVGDGIREGVGGIAEFLERYANLQFTFGLVEMALYRVRDSELLVQPRVLAKSTILNRSVIQIEGGSYTLATPAETEEQGPDERGAFYRQFWSEFLDELELDDVSQPMANVTQTENIFFMPIPGGLAWISAYFSLTKKEVGVYLGLTRSNFANLVIEDLLADREMLQDQLGVEAEWNGESHHPVVARMPVANPHAPENREAIKTFFADRVNRLINVFRPRLERIAADL